MVDIKFNSQINERYVGLRAGAKVMKVLTMHESKQEPLTQGSVLHFNSLLLAECRLVLIESEYRWVRTWLVVGYAARSTHDRAIFYVITGAVNVVATASAF